MADSISSVSVKVMPYTSEFKAAMLAELDSLERLIPPKRVRLDDDSIDRLATAIADKLKA